MKWYACVDEECTGIQMKRQGIELIKEFTTQRRGETFLFNERRKEINKINKHMSFLFYLIYYIYLKILF